MTASMDNVRIYSPIPINSDVYIQAYPTFVGNTSMEIRIDIFTQNSNN